MKKTFIILATLLFVPFFSFSQNTIETSKTEQDPTMSEKVGHYLKEIEHNINGIRISHRTELKKVENKYKYTIDCLDSTISVLKERITSDSIYISELKSKITSDSIDKSNLKSKISDLELSNGKFDSIIKACRDTIVSEMHKNDSLSKIIQKQLSKSNTITIELIRTSLYTKCSDDMITSLRNDFANISNETIKEENKTFDDILAIYQETINAIGDIIGDCYSKSKGFKKSQQDGSITKSLDSINNLEYIKTYYNEEYFTSPYLNTKINEISGLLNMIYNTDYENRDELIEEILNYRTKLISR